MEQNKFRISYLKKIIKLNPFLRLQCWERIQFKSKNQEGKDKSNILATKILNSSNKEYHTLIKYNQWLRTSIENDEISEGRYDLDNTSFEENLNIARKINTILSKHGIKCNIYSSGGKGIHIQYLFDISKFNLNVKIKNIDIDKYNEGYKEVNDYRNKKKNTDIKEYNLFKESSNERREVKRHILKELGIDQKKFKIDDRILLSTQELGLETGTHRKTNKRKTLIQYINLPNEKIISFIENNNKFFIDWKYLERINKIPESIINSFNSSIDKTLVKTNNVAKNQYKELKTTKPIAVKPTIKEKTIGELQWINICLKLKELKQKKNITSSSGTWENFGWYLSNLTYKQFKDKKEFVEKLRIVMKITETDYKQVGDDSEDINYKYIYETIFHKLENTFIESKPFGKSTICDISFNEYQQLFI